MRLEPSPDTRPEAVPAGETPSEAGAVLGAIQPTICPVVLPGSRVREKLAAGVPLLHGEDVYLDADAVSATWERLLGVLAQAGEAPSDLAAVRSALACHRLHVEHATVEALMRHPEHVQELARDAGLSVDLVQRLADLAARPVLAAYARQLAPALRLAPWSRRYCPLCGAPPNHDSQAGDDDAVRLVCGRCATGWALERGAGDDKNLAPAEFRLELADGEAGWDGYDDD